jgi:hypothetical protein
VEKELSHDSVEDAEEDPHEDELLVYTPFDEFVQASIPLA